MNDDEATIRAVLLALENARVGDREPLTRAECQSLAARLDPYSGTDAVDPVRIAARFLDAVGQNDPDRIDAEGVLGEADQQLTHAIWRRGYQTLEEELEDLPPA